VFTQNPYKTAKIKTSKLEAGATFNKNDIIGNDGLNDIKAEDDGFVLSKIINEDETILNIYLFNKFGTVFKITNRDYYLLFSFY